MELLGLSRPHCDVIVNHHNHPKMAELVRLVKYSRLSR